MNRPSALRNFRRPPRVGSVSSFAQSGVVTLAFLFRFGAQRLGFPQPAGNLFFTLAEDLIDRLQQRAIKDEHHYRHHQEMEQ